MKQLNTFYILFFLPICCFSQTLTPEVYPVAGDYYKTTKASLSWTIGECITETFSTSNNKLTQGFHQGNFIITTVQENKGKNIKLAFYPNPTRDILNITFSEFNSNYTVYLYDVAGNVVLTKAITEQNTTLDFSKPASGMYFLNVIDAENTVVKTFQVQKLN